MCEDFFEEKYNEFIREKYYDWVRGNSHGYAFIAERVGLDLDACQDYKADYKITLD